MSHIRGTDTGLEIRIRSAIWRTGMRFRTNYGRYKIDIAFPARKIAVFVDSCFWHGCPSHYRAPKTHTRFWSSKIERNRRRDSFVTQVLRNQGWAVIRVWEHEIERDAVAVARRISRKVVRRSADIGSPNGKRFPED